MSAEGMPRTEPSLLSKPLAWLTRFVVRCPLLVMVVGVAAAVAALLVSHSQLKFHTNRDDVLNPSSDYNRRWIEYAKEFGDEEDVVVVVEGPGRDAIVPVLDELATAIQGDPRHFHAVMHKVDLSKLHAKGLHYLKPADLAAIDGFLAQMDPILRGDWSQLSLINMASRMAAMPPPNGADASSPAAPMARQCQAKWMSSLATALSQRGAYQSPWPEMAAVPEGMDDLGADACRYFLLNDGRLGLVELRFVPMDKDVENFAQNTDAVDSLRAIVAKTKGRYPDVKIGLTGLPVMENDEMRMSQSAMTIITFLALGGIFLVLVAGFGGLRHSVVDHRGLDPRDGLDRGLHDDDGRLSEHSQHRVWLDSDGIGHQLRHLLCRPLFAIVRDFGIDRKALVKTAASVGPSITLGSVTAACSFFRHGVHRFSRRGAAWRHCRRRHFALLASGHDRAARHDHLVR